MRAVGTLTDPRGAFEQKLKPTKRVICLFRQSQYDNFRTILSANYAEIMENLNALEELINDFRAKSYT